MKDRIKGKFRLMDITRKNFCLVNKTKERNGVVKVVVPCKRS